MSKINENNNNFYWVYIIGFFMILTLPLLSIGPWFSPSSWIQAVVFRSLLTVIVFIYLLKEKIKFQKIKGALSLRSKIFIPLLSLLAYFFTVFISTLFSLDVSYSLWGNPNRGGGFINFLFLILFCLMGFMVVKDKDWKKIIDFSLIIGFLVGLLAVLQQSMIFKDSINSTSFRPASTLGNPIILALFLLLFFFLSLSFFISESPSTNSGRVKKYSYLFLVVFYSFLIIFITQTRVAILGLFVGLFWFLIFYPLPAMPTCQAGVRQVKKMRAIKIGTIIFSAVFIIFIFFLSGNPKIYEKWPDFIKEPVSRMTSLTKGFSADPSRMSAWKISISAFFEKPYLGYGPENFYIAFNKHYDPTLPAMEDVKDFDRAHNSLIQILIDSGIFALIFYLIFFFSFLWGLQKIKKIYPIAHGLQAGFIAFFIASLTSIDGFAIMLIFFLLSAYSLHLIYSASANNPDVVARSEVPKQSSRGSLKKTGLVFAFLVLILFLWQYNFVPIQMNKQLNVAQALVTENWQESFKIMEEQSKIKTFFLPYVNSVYLNLLIDRIISHPEDNSSLSEKVAEISKKNTELQPYDYRNWLRLGESLETISQEKKDPQIAKEADEAFKKALKLNPKNPTIILTYFMADVFVKDFEKAKEQSVYCLKTFPESRECLWISGLIDIYLNNYAEGKDFLKRAKENGYPTESKISLRQLVAAYIENKDYKEMLPIYQKLSEIDPGEVQYKTSLMLVYKNLGQYDKARQLALEIIKTNPELKGQIEQFLRSF